MIVMDEPSLITEALAKYRTQLAEGFESSQDPLAEPPNNFIFDDEEWGLALEMAPRLVLDRLGMLGAERAGWGEGSPPPDFWF